MSPAPAASGTTSAGERSGAGQSNSSRETKMAEKKKKKKKPKDDDKVEMPCEACGDFTSNIVMDGNEPRFMHESCFHG